MSSLSIYAHLGLCRSRRQHTRLLHAHAPVNAACCGEGGDGTASNPITHHILAREVEATYGGGGPQPGLPETLGRVGEAVRLAIGRAKKEVVAQRRAYKVWRCCSVTAE